MNYSESNRGCGSEFSAGLAGRTRADWVSAGFATNFGGSAFLASTIKLGKCGSAWMAVEIAAVFDVDGVVVLGGEEDGVAA